MLSFYLPVRNAKLYISDVSNRADLHTALELLPGGHPKTVLNQHPGTRGTDRSAGVRTPGGAKRSSLLWHRWVDPGPGVAGKSSSK